MPPERDPTKLFNKLFGTGAPGAPADISNSLRRSVLDAVLEEANDLKMAVGFNDAKRIDSHMESIRAIEMRLPQTEDGGSPNRTAPAVPPIALAGTTAQSQARSSSRPGDSSDQLSVPQEQMRGIGDNGGKMAPRRP